MIYKESHFEIVQFLCLQNALHIFLKVFNEIELNKLSSIHNGNNCKKEIENRPTYDLLGDHGLQDSKHTHIIGKPQFFVYESAFSVNSFCSMNFCGFI